MAENLDPFHVRQLNRRSKLRVVTTQNKSQEQENPPFLMNPSPFSTLQNPTYHPLTAVTHQGLSLSLSFHQPDSQKCTSNNNGVSVFGDFLKQNGTGGGIRSSVPLGPFTGYASILKSSRFLKPAQQILDDICGHQAFNSSTSSTLDFLNLSEVIMRSGSVGFSDQVEHQWKNSKLMFMLDEVYRRYKLYCQQMQSVVASFEAVAGLGNAAPYICNAIKIVSKHFTCLKNVLLDQIHFTGRKTFNDCNIRTNEKIPSFWTADEQGLQNQNFNFNFLQHPIWRTHRALPDRAVALLKTWLFEHFLHPYPTDSEKKILAQQTGLSRTQVSNWFINARVRLWKPMVEETYKLASQQSQSPLEAVDHDNVSVPSDFCMGKQLQTSHQQKPETIQTKRSRNELADVSTQSQEQMSVSNFNNLPSHYQNGIHGSNGIGVSLALGLHQNSGIDLSAPLPINIAQHVNLEMIKMMDSASAASFRAQNQHFGKD